MDLIVLSMKKVRMHYCTAKRRDGEIIVQNGLAITPAEVLRNAEIGIPVSSMMVSGQFFDGTDKLDFQPDLSERRGIDIADLWQARRESIRKFNEAYNSFKGSPVESK